MNQNDQLNENNTIEASSCNKCSNCSKCHPKPKVKKEKVYLPRDCKVCNKHYEDEYELKRFHGKKCRLCRNAYMLKIVKNKMEMLKDNEAFKQYQNDYARAYYREHAAERTKKSVFKPHKDRIYTPERSTIRLSNYMNTLTINE